MASDAAVSFREVSKWFGRQVLALDRVAFDVPKGSLFGLLGPNGAGKTTLFSIAADYLRASAGSIETIGIDSRRVSDLAGRVTMLPQDAAFQGSVPVIEQLVTFGRLQGQDAKTARASAARALDLVGLGDVMQRAARALSHGMAKRVALAQAFLGDPEVVFLDEPTSGLDPATASSIRAYIRNMAGNRTVIMSSHNLAEIQEMCSDCAVLHKGRLAAVGSMRDFLGADSVMRVTFAKPPTDAFTASLLRVRGVAGVAASARGGLDVSLHPASDRPLDALRSDVLRAMLDAGFVPATLKEGQTLEERFLAITGGAADDLGGT